MPLREQMTKIPVSKEQFKSPKVYKERLIKDFHVNLKNLSNVAYSPNTNTYILLFSGNRVGERNMEYVKRKGEVIDVLYSFRDSSHLSATEIDKIPLDEVISLSLIVKPHEDSA